MDYKGCADQNGRSGIAHKLLKMLVPASRLELPTPRALRRLRKSGSRPRFPTRIILLRTFVSPGLFGRYVGSVVMGSL